MKTIFLNTATCDAIRAAAPKFGMIAAPMNNDPLVRALSPQGTEPVDLTDEQFDTFETLRKRRKISADKLAVSLVA
jgi:hypothetical protein